MLLSTLSFCWCFLPVFCSLWPVQTATTALIDFRPRRQTAWESCGRLLATAATTAAKSEAKAASQVQASEEPKFVRCTAKFSQSELTRLPPLYFTFSCPAYFLPQLSRQFIYSTQRKAIFRTLRHSTCFYSFSTFSVSVIVGNGHRQTESARKESEALISTRFGCFEQPYSKRRKE